MPVLERRKKIRRTEKKSGTKRKDKKNNKKEVRGAVDLRTVIRSEFLAAASRML